VTETAIVRFARRVRDRVRLAWDESRVWTPPTAPDLFAADAGETRFLPTKLAHAGSRFPTTDPLPTIESVEARLGAPADAIRLVAGAWVPHDDESIRAFADHVRGWGRMLPAGERLYWVQPLSNNFVLSRDDAEQLLGLAGPVDFVESAQAAGGRGACLIAAGTVRLRACTVGLCWRADLVADPVRLSGALNRLHRMAAAVREGVHIIEAPGAAVAEWRAGAARLVRALSEQGNASFGIRVAHAGHETAPILSVLAQSHDVMVRVGMQWIDDCDRSDVPPAPPPLLPGIVCDCSLSLNGPASARPYVRHGPYVPLAFDARVPAWRAGATPIVEMPRVGGHTVPACNRRGWERITTSPEREAARALHALVDLPVDRVYDRLLEALDTKRRRAYLRALDGDPKSVDRWHQFHVYNWPPPPDRVLRFIVYDAADLTRRDSALRAFEYLQADDVVLSGRALIATIRAAADAGRSAGTLREQQIVAHEYLATGGRRELTADSERLIAELPAALGATLEIGFGYGLTAQRVARRASAYVGIDLQPAQARTLRSHGSHGLVADIHWLPLASETFDTVLADNVLEHAASPIDVLQELRRVLRPAGRAYILIPPDASTSEFQIRTHLWKADERSITRAARLAGFRVVKLQVLSYADLAVYGCFPASAGRTCLVILERPAGSAERLAS
jgi:hypothetical protein